MSKCDTGAVVNAISTSPRKNCVVVAGREILKIYNYNGEIVEKMNLRIKDRLNLNFSSNDVKWSLKSENIIVTAATTGAILVWDINKPGLKIDRIITEHLRAVNRVSFHHQSPLTLISGSQDGTMKLWDLRVKGSCQKTFHGKEESCRDVQFSQNPYEFVSVFETGIFQRWDIRNPNHPETRFNAHNGFVLCVDIHPSGSIVATGGRDKLIKIWNLKKQDKKPIFSIQTIACLGRIAWQPNDTMNIAASSLVTDYRIHLFNVQKYVPTHSWETHENVVTGFVWSDASTIWSCSKDKTIARTSLSDAVHVSDSLTLSSSAWSPNGAIVTVDKNVSIYYSQDFDFVFFQQMAKFASFDKEFKKNCELNAELSLKLGNPNFYRMWLIVQKIFEQDFALPEQILLCIFDSFADDGYVQFCSILCLCLGKKSLQIFSNRVKCAVNGYIDLLQRFEMHECVAKVNKHLPYSSEHKFAFKNDFKTCSFCHKQVKGLGTWTQCGHGGHMECISLIHKVTRCCCACGVHVY